MGQGASPETGHILISENGSVLVEMALALPILVLLLFGGLDIGRYLQLTQRADQAAMAIVDGLIEDPNFSPDDLTINLALATSILTLGNEQPYVEISVKSYSLSPEGTRDLYFNQSEGSVPIPCENSDPPPVYSIAAEEPSAPYQYYFRVRVCVIAADAFFLSNFLPLKRTAISAISLGSGKQWSNIPVPL